KQKAEYEVPLVHVGSEMFIRNRIKRGLNKGLNSINICVSIYISIWWVEKWGGGLNDNKKYKI
ncbi:hypothetical protein A0N84_04560, partial [Campylobacter jejuni]